MKILVDARTMGSCPSGVGMYLFDFVKELSNDGRFTLILVTDVAESEQMRFLAERGLTIRTYGKKVFRSIGVFPYFRFLERVLLEEQPELFWEPNNLLPFYPKAYKGKIILTIHDLFPITEPECFSRLYRLYFRLRIGASIRQSDAILFNSDETRRQVCETFPAASSRKNFISYSIVRKPPARRISDDGFFLYIGNLERRKGTDLLLAAYRLYWQAGGRRPLLLGGKVREAAIQEELDIACSQGGDIRYLGYLNETEKYDYLSECSCFLFPSRAEGFGIPPLEAIGYRKPVVVSDLPVFREILLAPFVAMPIRENPEVQAHVLSEIMLAESYRAVSEEESSAALERYDGAALGKKLAVFFESMAMEDA